MFCSVILLLLLSYFSFGVLQLMLPEAPQPYGLLYYPRIGHSNFLHRFRAVIYMFKPFATSSLREILTAKGGKLCGREMAGKFSLKMPDFHVAFRDLSHALNLRHGTQSFTSLPKGRRAEDFFFRPDKSDGFGRV
jgi:hypothetical protein